MPEPAPSFEQAIAELEAIVQELERGQPTLEESLARFERGVKLLRQCRQVLEAAELRIRELVEIDEHGNARLREFGHEATVTKPRRGRTSTPKPDVAPDSENDAPNEALF
jgi:exodeoxyribonuclease VII small subunit